MTSAVVLLALVGLTGELLGPPGPLGVAEEAAALVDAAAGPALPFAGFGATQEQALARAVGDALVGHPIPGVAGVAVGVLHRGRAWRRGWGVVDHRGTPATSQTPFRLASITKTFTAIATLQLVQEGRLSLDDTVGALLPTAPPPWRGITVRQLLNHTSGIRHYPPRGPERFLDVHLSVDETIALIAKRPLAARPGRRFLYTTYGYNVLGAILERIEERPYAELLTDRILDPLGMTGTFVEDSRARRPDWPEGLRRTRRGDVVPSRRIDLSSRFAGGGLRGTIDDLLRYADALLHHHLVDAPTFRQMATPAVLEDGTSTDYGLGFAVYPQRGHLVVAHAGGQPETTTLLYLIPAEGLAVVAATALEGQGTALSAIADAVVEVLVEGGVVRRDVVTRDHVDDAVVFVIQRATSWGRALVDDDSVAADAAEVDAAFARFHGLLDERRLKRSPAAVKKQARELHHPKQGRVTPIVGAVVARTVREVDGDASARWSARGPLALFARYVEVCDAEPARCPPGRRLRPALAARLTRLQQAFSAVSPPPALALRTIDVLAPDGVERAVALLAPMVGADSHPDYSDDLVAATERLALRRPHDAVTVARLNAALHPQNARAALSLAEALLLADDEDGAAVALDDAWRRGGATALPATLWARRVAWLRGLPLPRGPIAADALEAFAERHGPPLPDDHGDDDP
jgi:CubicO group peptidase (beta-lactamase class C family)